MASYLPYAPFVPPTPGALSPYGQFRLSQGTKAIERGAAARGTLLTGGLQTRLAEFGQGLASEEAGNDYQRALSTYTTNRATNAMNVDQQPPSLASSATNAMNVDQQPPSLASMGAPSSSWQASSWQAPAPPQPGLSTPTWATTPQPIRPEEASHGADWQSPSAMTGTGGSWLSEDTFNAPHVAESARNADDMRVTAYRDQMQTYARQQEEARQAQTMALQQQGRHDTLTAAQQQQLLAEQQRQQMGADRVNAYPRPRYLPYPDPVQPERGAARA